MKPGPRRSISQADIVDAAFDILERKGFAAVSVRGVAAALGLTPTAMYTYFPSKNALLRAMVEQLLSTIDLGAASDAEAAWRDRVHALTAALRSRLAEHAGAIVLMTSGPPVGPHALGLNEALITGFAAEGMPPADAARAAHAVRAYVLGIAAIDAAERGPASMRHPMRRPARRRCGRMPQPSRSRRRPLMCPAPTDSHGVSTACSTGWAAASPDRSRDEAPTP
jgi:TetR/AcrR family tetracycline transcriptional repressor